MKRLLKLAALVTGGWGLILAPVSGVSTGVLMSQVRMELRSGSSVVGFVTLGPGTRVEVVGTNSGGYQVRRNPAESPFNVASEVLRIDQPQPVPASYAETVPAKEPQAAASPSPTPSSTPPPAEGQPGVSEVNKALGVPLFTETSLWEENDAMVANRLRWPQESKTTREAGYRRYPYTFNSDTRIFGVRALSLFLLGTADKPSRIDILLANKGDVAFYMSPEEASRQKADQPLNVTDGMMHRLQDAMRSDKAGLESGLRRLFGNPKPVSLGRFQATRESAQRWDWKGSSFLLVDQPGEYVALRILPTAVLDDQDSARKAFAAAKGRIAECVERRANGDVVVGDLPMVDQGRKGYCVPATFERLLRYYGLPGDMNLLAMAGKTRAGGGTSVSAIEGAVQSVVYDAGGTISPRNFSGSILEIKPLIDAGRPLIFAHYSTEEFNKRVNERMARRIAVTNWDDWAGKFLPAFKKGPPLRPDPMWGHVCLIIGYNEKTREIAISDSWGPQATERWMTEEEARQILQPSGLSVIE
jgi:hypothetical protein